MLTHEEGEEEGLLPYLLVENNNTHLRGTARKDFPYPTT